ncbi:ABC transporter ATP-binding protein [Euzebya tangerina]|uniref:ABC transporter ATP-binding protein n=1 Tax=Euzebya tangerina TaxID=591198 RepID=UPI00196A2A39|nr:ABC transporter ATP-binding protein [Euzebya tangerina]
MSEPTAAGPLDVDAHPVGPRDLNGDADRSHGQRPAVSVEHVDVRYQVYAEKRRSLRRLLAGDARQRQQREIHAVRDVSFMVQSGEAIGVLGHNGSGKSTLLRAIGGLMPVSGGAVRVRSLPVLLGVKAALEGDLSARANVILGGLALQIPRKVLQENMDDIIEFAGVEEHADIPLRAFSSGMKARLQFAISTVVSPEILLIDEALSVGDAEFKAKSDDRIREMMADASTVFLVSHSPKNITDICSRAIWLDQGRLIADGPAEDVVEAYQDHVEELRRRRRQRKRAQQNSARTPVSG